MLQQLSHAPSGTGKLARLLCASCYVLVARTFKHEEHPYAKDLQEGPRKPSIWVQRITSFRGIFEVYDTIATVGTWDDNVGNS